MFLFEDPGIDEVRGLSLRNLNIDQAWLVLNNSLDSPAWLYALSDDCDRCAYKLLGSVQPHANSSLKVDVKHGWALRFRTDNSSAHVPNLPDSNVLCQLYASMGQFGVYDVQVSPLSTGRADCRFSIIKEPVDIYMPLLACFVFFFVLAIIWISLSKLAKRDHLESCFGKLKSLSNRKKGSDTSQLDIDAVQARKPSNRLKSLDTFRGISIVTMIFVNDGAGQYWFFEHATWNGLLVADLVFPWFMWIMGVCLPIALRSARRRKETKLTTFSGVLRRSCMLFLLGIVNNSVGGANNLDTLRIPGVLQRFAITYLIVGSIGLFLTPVDISAPDGSSLARRMFQDVVILWPQWLLMALLVAGHCFITFFLPVLDADCPTGYLGPGGLHLDGAYSGKCIGGAAGYIDRWMLTTKHIYNWPTTREVYESGPYDPEGILGSMLSVFQVFLGAQAGMTLLVFSDWRSRIYRWLVWSVTTGALAAFLCLASKDDGWIPVNKNLWSLSFVLVTTCFAFFLLSVCYFLIDVKKWWNGAPFFYPGMNSIVMYMGHQIAYNLFPWNWQSGPMNTHFARLVETLWGVSLWVAIATWLHYKKIFVSL